VDEQFIGARVFDHTLIPHALWILTVDATPCAQAGPPGSVRATPRRWRRAGLLAVCISVPALSVSTGVESVITTVILEVIVLVLILILVRILRH
jgi:hypothetical protein